MKNSPVFALLVLQAALYLYFLTADLFFVGSYSSTLAKYLSILLCPAVAYLLSHGTADKRDSRLLIAALSLTCAADAFLLLLNRPIPGLIIFCIVHLVYIRRYRKRASISATAIAAFLIAGCFVANALLRAFPLTQALGCVYGLLLLSASLSGFSAPLPKISRRFIITGMILFLLCDIHVALFNALPPDNPYYPFAAFLMWFFYLPAQVLLALSGSDDTKQHETTN